MGNPSKWGETVDAIRRLVGRPAAGVPLDVADDVARAATRHSQEMHGSNALWDDMRASQERYGTSYLFSPQRGGTSVDGTKLFDDVINANMPEGPTLSRPAAAEDFELGSPLWHQLDKGYRANDNLRRGRTPNLRNQDPQLARIAGQELNSTNSAARATRAADAQRAQGMREGLGELGAAAATVGIGAGLSSMYPSGETPTQGDMTDTSGTEDLAAESRPAPSVEPDMPPDEQEFADRFKRQYLAREAKRNAPVDYSFQARELMGKLNAMRKAAGGEVPEAKQMMAEIDRLLGMANQQKNAPGYKPAMPTDYHGEAQRLLQDLNARRMEAGGEVADTQKVMAEVRRLQAMGDQMRNAR